MRSLSILTGAIALAALGACSGNTGSAPPTGSVAEAVQNVRKVPVTDNPYTLFETLQTRPLALSADGQLLFAANTPDNRVEVFRVHHNGLQPVSSVVVGLEPIAIAARPNGDVWVVNHLSDSISILSVDDSGHARVTNTLLVGDEPRDIVFAGPNGSRAFITTAHRGQNSPDDPDLFNPATGRADVWVFDANNLGSGGGSRLTKITLFADTPRALAASADGKTVYAAAFFSGNQTTVVSEDAVDQVYGGVMPGPAAINLGGQIDPAADDGPGREVEARARQRLPLDRRVRDDLRPVRPREPPRPGRLRDRRDGEPAGGRRAPTPTSARRSSTWRSTRRTGRSTSRTPTRTTTRGSRATRRASRPSSATSSTAASASSTRRAAGSPRTTSTRTSNHAAGTGDPTLSRAFPQDLAFTRDGKTVYVVAQGSSKLAIYDSASLEAGSAAPSASNQVVLTAGGPTGVALDEHDGLAFVLTRFDDGISIVDLEGTQGGRARQDVQPRAVERDGRPPVPLRREHHVGARRPGLRELPHRRRLRRPGVGPRQPGRLPAAHHQQRGERRGHPHDPAAVHRGAHRPAVGRLHLRRLSAAARAR